MLFGQFHLPMVMNPACEVLFKRQPVVYASHLSCQLLELALSGCVFLPLVKNDTDWPVT